MKNNSVQKAHSIYSTEEDKMVDVTDEQIRTASYIHQQVVLGVFISAIGIKKIFDDKLFYALGCQSRDEYIDNMLPYGRRQAYVLFKIANKFDSVSKELTGNNLKPIGLSDGSLEVHPNALIEETEGLGIKKLYELTKIDDEDLGKLIKNGKAKINGEEISLEELKDMTYKDASKLIKKATGKYKEEIKHISGKLAQAQEEVKLLKSEKDIMFEENRIAKKIEQRYGAAAGKLKDKVDCLDEARHLLNDFNEVLIRAGVTVEDPETIQNDLTDLIRKIEAVYNTMLNTYDEVIAAAV